jgi:hypothetical protein
LQRFYGCKIGTAKTSVVGQLNQNTGALKDALWPEGIPGRAGRGTENWCFNPATEERSSSLTYIK